MDAKINTEYHPVTNFKKDTSLIKRIGANILFFVGTTKITLRNNLLTPKEYRKVKKLIQPGDIILVGDHRHVSSMLIQGAVTHTLIYLGRGRCVHAVGHGVATIELRELFKIYDTLTIARPRVLSDKKNEIIQSALKFAMAQLGKPYDYEFDTDMEKFFCTQLACESYRHAGFDLGLADYATTTNPITEQLRRWKNAVRPVDIARGNIDIIFLSKYLKNENGSIILSKPIWIKNAQDNITRIISK